MLIRDFVLLTSLTHPAKNNQTNALHFIARFIYDKTMIILMITVVKTTKMMLVTMRVKRTTRKLMTMRVRRKLMKVIIRKLMTRKLMKVIVASDK